MTRSPGAPGRGQHQHHGPVLAVGDHLAERIAVDARQVAVEDDHVVAVEVELGRRLQAVVRGVDRHALVAQALDQHVGERPGVLDHQHPHAGTPDHGPRPGGGGRSTLARSPPPGLASRSSRPSCASAIAATIDRPRPEPLSVPIRSAPEPPERLGQLVDLPLIEDLAAVLDDQPGPPGLGLRRDCGPSRRPRCDRPRCRSGSPPGGTAAPGCPCTHAPHRARCGPARSGSWS